MNHQSNITLVLGTWFPRTILHLEEVENAVRDTQTMSSEITPLARSLGIVRIDRHQDAFVLLQMQAIPPGEERPTISLTLTEDGILLLETAALDLERARRMLRRYYEERLSPFLDALFRRGMPLPKELANVQAILPFFVLIRGGSREEAAHFTQDHHGPARPRARVRARVSPLLSWKHLSVFQGSVTTVVHSADRGAISSDHRLTPEELVRLLTFFRECEGQMHTYLRLHRDVWESVREIHRTRHLRYRDLAATRDRLNAQRETIGFVQARIAQLGDILSARSTAIHEAGLDLPLRALRLDRFDSLAGTHQYLRHLWDITYRFTEMTESLLRFLYEDNLRREVGILNIIVLSTLLTGYFGMNVPLPWEERWSTQWLSTATVTLFLLVAGVSGYLLLHALVLSRRFMIRETERSAFPSSLHAASATTPLRHPRR